MEKSKGAFKNRAYAQSAFQILAAKKIALALHDRWENLRFLH
ncbi:MAG: hypothetical protein ACXWV1_02945 [Chitinophagaceae bacterium]